MRFVVAGMVALAVLLSAAHAGSAARAHAGLPTLALLQLVGGPKDEWNARVAVGGSGNVFLAGTTSSRNWPAPWKSGCALAGGLCTDAFLMKLSPDAKRVYIPRSADIMVVDESTGKMIGDISGMQGLHGVAVAPEFNRGFVTGNDPDAEIPKYARYYSYYYNGEYEYSNGVQA